LRFARRCRWFSCSSAFIAYVLEGPDPEQDGISSYTLDDLAELAKTRWNASYHPASMSRVVRRLGFSRQKARPSNPKSDPAAQAAFKKSP
jgi:transposase